MLTDFAITALQGRSSYSSIANIIKLGTGTTEFTTASTDLTTVAASVPGLPYIIDQNVMSFRFYCVLPSTGLVGVPLSEVGLYRDATAIALSLIKDSEGTPVTVTMLEGDTLTVAFDYTLVYDTTPTTGTVTIAGVDHNYTLTMISFQSNGSDDMDFRETFYKVAHGTPTLVTPSIAARQGVVWSGNQQILSASIPFDVINNQSFGITKIRWGYASRFSTLNYAGGIAELTLSRVDDPTKGWIRAPNESVVANNLVTLTFARAE